MLLQLHICMLHITQLSEDSKQMENWTQSAWPNIVEKTLQYTILQVWLKKYKLLDEEGKKCVMLQWSRAVWLCVVIVLSIVVGDVQIVQWNHCSSSCTLSHSPRLARQV